MSAARKPITIGVSRPVWDLLRARREAMSVELDRSVTYAEVLADVFARAGVRSDGTVAA